MEALGAHGLQPVVIYDYSGSLVRHTENVHHHVQLERLAGSPYDSGALGRHPGSRGPPGPFGVCPGAMLAHGVCVQPLDVVCFRRPAG